MFANFCQSGTRKSSAKSTTSRRQTGALDTPDSDMPPPTPFKYTKPQPQESRRRSYMPPITDLRTSRSFQDALSRNAFGDSNNIDLIEPGEEFAPSADVDDVPARSRRRSGQVRQKSRGDDISNAALFFWCLVFILSLTYCVFWRQEKFIVGFCGVPQTERMLLFRLDDSNFQRQWQIWPMNTILTIGEVRSSTPSVRLVHPVHPMHIVSQI